MGLEISQQVSVGELFTLFVAVGSLIAGAVTIKFKSSEAAKRTEEINGVLDAFKEKHADINTRLSLIEEELSGLKSRQKYYDEQIVKEIQELRVAVAKIEVKITRRLTSDNE